MRKISKAYRYINSPTLLKRLERFQVAVERKSFHVEYPRNYYAIYKNRTNLIHCTYGTPIYLTGYQADIVARSMGINVYY